MKTIAIAVFVLIVSATAAQAQVCDANALNGAVEAHQVRIGVLETQANCAAEVAQELENRLAGFGKDAEADRAELAKEQAKVVEIQNQLSELAKNPASTPIGKAIFKKMAADLRTELTPIIKAINEMGARVTALELRLSQEVRDRVTADIKEKTERIAADEAKQDKLVPEIGPAVIVTKSGVTGGVAIDLVVPSSATYETKYGGIVGKGPNSVGGAVYVMPTYKPVPEVGVMVGPVAIFDGANNGNGMHSADYGVGFGVKWTPVKQLGVELIGGPSLHQEKNGGAMDNELGGFGIFQVKYRATW